MSAIKDWIEELKNTEGFDINAMQDNILRLGDIDLEYDKTLADMEEMRSAVEKKDQEINDLKSRVWDLFKSQTGVDMKKDEKTNPGNKEEKKDKINVEDYIKYD